MIDARPLSWVKTDDRISFVYDKSDLNEFHKLGKKHGDVGMIIMYIQDNILHYSGYGTYEHPCKERHNMAMVAWPEFDGEDVLNPDAYLRKEPSEKESGSYEFIIFDMKNEKTD